MFRFAGTFISIIMISVMFQCFGQTSFCPVITWKESFAFEALISAFDPVSVLAVFKEVDADENLFAVDFGDW